MSPFYLNIIYMMILFYFKTDLFLGKPDLGDGKSECLVS